MIGFSSGAAPAATDTLRTLLSALADPQVAKDRLDAIAKAEADLAASIEKAADERDVLERALQARQTAQKTAESALVQRTEQTDEAHRRRAEILTGKEREIERRENVLRAGEQRLASATEALETRLDKLQRTLAEIR